MRDKHGNEIKVGDTVRFDYAKDQWKQGLVSAVKSDACRVDEWSSWWYRVSDYVEVVIPVKQEQSPKSLSELKHQAQQEILELIQKHTALINSAGGNFGVSVSMYDVQGIISKHPKQLVDVNVTVTI